MSSEINPSEVEWDAPNPADIVWDKPAEPKAPPGVMGTIENVGRNVLAGTLDTAASLISPMIAPTIGADETMLEKTRGKIKGWAEDVAAPQTTSKAYDYPIEAVRSTTRSLTNLVPFALARGKGTPLRNRIIGAVGGKGAMFGVDEYTEFMLDARNEFKKQGLSNEEIEQTLSKIRPYAGASGAAEVAGEWTSDILTARVFGLLGDATVKPAVKQTLKQVAANYGKKFGISAFGEVGGETGTTVAQHYAREGAGLPTGSLKDEIIDTIGVTLWQTLYQGTLSAGVNRARQRAVNKIVENNDISKEEAGVILDQAVQQEKDTVAEKPAAEQLDLTKAGTVNEAAVAELETIAAAAEKEEDRAAKAQEWAKTSMKELEKRTWAELEAAYKERIKAEKEEKKAAKQEAMLTAREQRKAAREARKVKPAETVEEIDKKIEDLKVKLQERGAEINAAVEKQAEEIRAGLYKTTEVLTEEAPVIEEEKPTVKISPKGQTPISKANALAVLKQKGLSDEDAVVFYNMREALGDLDGIKTVEDFSDWYDKDTEPEDWASALGGEDAERLRGVEEEVSGRGPELSESEAESGKNLEQPVLEGKGEPTSREKRKAKRQASRKVKEVKESGEVKVETKTEGQREKASKEEVDIGDELEEAIYSSRADAEIALLKLDQEIAKDYVIIGDKNEFYIQHKRHLPTSTSEKAVGIPTNSLYKTAEETAQETLPQDDSLDSGLTRLVHDINNWFHNSEDADELRQYAEVIAKTIAAIEANPRDFLNMFNGDVLAYDKWVDKLNRLAGYVSDISRVKLGNRVGALETSDLAAGISEIFGQDTSVMDSMRGYSEETMDFMGMQKAYEMLVELGRRVYASAKENFNDWMLQMRAYLSNVWKDVKPYMLQVWDVINNEQGKWDIGIVYHGTIDWIEKFSTEFVGKTNGTMFGHGLYFSDLKSIAEWYAKNAPRWRGVKAYARFGKVHIKDVDKFSEYLEANDKIEDIISFVKYKDILSAKKKANELLTLYNRRRDEVINRAYKSGLKPVQSIIDSVDNIIYTAKNIIESLETGDYEVGPTKYVYNVALGKGKEEGLELLDWYEDVPTEQMNMIIAQAEKEDSRLAENLSKQRPDRAYDTTGQRIYQYLSNYLKSAKKASEFLKRAGIDGNVYPVDTGGSAKRRYRTDISAPGMSDRLMALFKSNSKDTSSLQIIINRIKNDLLTQIEGYESSIEEYTAEMNQLKKKESLTKADTENIKWLRRDIDEYLNTIKENSTILDELYEYEKVPELIRVEKKLNTKAEIKTPKGTSGILINLLNHYMYENYYEGDVVKTIDKIASDVRGHIKEFNEDNERQIREVTASPDPDITVDQYKEELRRDIENRKNALTELYRLLSEGSISVDETPALRNNYVIFSSEDVDIEGYVTLGFLGLQGMYETLTKMYNQWQQRRTWHRDREERFKASDQSDHTIHYVKDDDISGAWTWFMHAMMPAHKGFSDLARKVAVHIGQAKLLTNHLVEIEREFIEKNVASKLDKKQRRDAQTLGLAVERFSRMKRKEFTDMKMAPADVDIQTKAAVAAYIAGYKEADQTTKDVYQFARTEFFEKMRKKYIDHMIRQAHYRLSAKYKPVIDGIDAGIPPNQVLQQLGITKAGEIKKALSEYKSYKEDINSIRNWGTEDYWTHMMTGDIIVTEKTGKSRSDKGMVIAAAPDIDLAMERAKKYIEEKIARGEKVGDLSIREGFAYQGDMKTMLSKRKYILVASRLDKAVEKALKGGGQPSGVKDEARRILRKNLKDIVGIKPTQVFAAPTMETKNLLMGEDDIVDAMSMYAYAMHKKMSFDPIIDELRTAQDKLGDNEYLHLESVLDDAKGKYYLEDRILDATISTLTGGAIDAHRSASKTIDRLRNMTVMLKLGYRPVAGLLNGADGYSRIAMQLGVRYLGRAQKLLSSNTAEKKLVDKYSWALGARAFEQGGTISGGVRVGSHVLKGGKQLITPLGMFNLMELPARRANFLAAYLYSKDHSPNLSEREHADFATLSVWTLQGANLVSMMPRLMRSPTGRLLTLFQPFVARTVEWMIMNASSPAFWAKFLGYTAAVAGPRGLIAMAKTLPLVAFAFAAMGGGDWWDKLEEYMQRKLGGWASGAPGGAAGVDVVGPATVQLPSVEKDVLSPLGPVIASIRDLYGVAMSFNPAETVANQGQEAKAHLKKAIPAIRNIWDVIDSYYDQDGFVYNEKGDPIYNLDSKYDKALVAFGAKPVSKSYMETLSRIETKAQELERKHVSQILSEYSNEVRRLTNEDYRNLREDDPRISSAWNRMQEKIADYNVSPEALETAATRFAKKPGVRLLLRTRQTRQPEMLEKLEEAGPTFGVDFLQ